ncbi:MAG: FHA domain-containing protein [Desulfobacterales bacterium]|nr:FHA domain-containing protein [Desulfobacterales bacterium]
MTKLFMVEGPEVGLSFEIGEGTTIVGRAPENGVHLNDQSVTRRHAKITRKEDKFYIEDLNSQNGTSVNGYLISPGFQVQIKEGDFIVIGNISMCLGEPYAEDGMGTHFSISLQEQSGEKSRNLLYQDRRMTDRDKLEMIYEVSTILMQSLDIEEISEKMMESIFSCLRTIDSGAVLLTDPQTGEHKEIIAKAKNREGRVSMDYSRTIVNRVISEGTALMMSDTSLADKADLSASIILMRIKSVMCVPLVSKSKTYGVIYAHSVAAAQGFRREDLFLLTALSTPAALAIENALLYSKTKKAEEALQKARADLERRVKERTNELSQANALLKQEVAERQQAEENLKAMHQQLKEANRNLELAYAQMRDAKDHLGTQLYGEEIAFLINDKGQILGFNEKALEIAGQSRFKLIGRDIGDLLEQEFREKVLQDIRDAWKGIFHQTSFGFKGAKAPQEKFQAKLIPVDLEREKRLLILVRRLDRKR